MTLLRGAIALLVAAAFFVVAAPSFAQGSPQVLIANPTSLARTDATGNAIDKRASFTPEGINLWDCQADQRVLLPTTITNASSPTAHFDVWAGPQGADCTLLASRVGDSAKCSSILANLPVPSSSRVAVPVRAIVAAAKPGAAADASICGAVDFSTVTVFAMVIDGSDTLASATVVVEVDTFPNPVPQVIVDQVEGTVHVTATPDPSTVTSQFAVYCAEADGGDAGACTGSAISYSATSPDPDFDARYRCITIVKDMAPYDAYVKTLADGSQFGVGANVAVRVSSVDAFGNISPMSAPQCAIEETVADVGDRTGCSSGSGRGPRDPAFVGSILALVGLAIAARRRQVAR